MLINSCCHRYESKIQPLDFVSMLLTFDFSKISSLRCIHDRLQNPHPSMKDVVRPASDKRVDTVGFTRADKMEKLTLSLKQAIKLLKR